MHPVLQKYSTGTLWSDRGVTKYRAGEVANVCYETKWPVSYSADHFHNRYCMWPKCANAHCGPCSSEDELIWRFKYAPSRQGACKEVAFWTVLHLVEFAFWHLQLSWFVFILQDLRSVSPQSKYWEPRHVLDSNKINSVKQGNLVNWCPFISQEIH
jgi:hypothetical protein